jgi:multiple sugar transport system substrate-binding protein
MTRTRRSVGITVSLAIALLLAACSSTTSTSTKPSAKAVSSGPVTISFMESMASGTQVTALPHLVSEFEKANPKITVDLIVEPNYATLQAKEEAAIAAGDPPTIAQAYTNLAATYAASNVIVPLTPYVNGPSGLTKTQESEIVPAIWKNIHLADGQIWMWPFTKTILLDYYNKTLLTADHLSVPTTWNQVLADAPVLEKSGHWAFSINPGSLTGPQHGTSLFLAMIIEYGGKWIVNNKPDFNSPAAIKALSVLTSLAKSGALKTGTSYPGQAALDAGHAAFDFSSNTGYPYQVSGIGNKFTLAEAPLPAGPSGESNYINGTSIVLFKKSTAAQKDAAWTFMKFLTSPAAMAYWSTETGYLAVNQAAIPLMKSYNATHPFQTIANSSVVGAEATPGYAWWTTAVGQLANAEASAISGVATPKAALDQAQTEALSDVTSGASGS